MGQYVLPPATRLNLNDFLADEYAQVYLVIGPEDGNEAWETAKAQLGGLLSAELILATSTETVADLLDRHGSIGWPKGTHWGPEDAEAAGAEIGDEVDTPVPTAICFGYGQEPIFYLTQVQAEGLDEPRDAFLAAGEE